jgi:hypothetical protein
VERFWLNQKLLLAGAYLLFVGVGCSLGPANDGTRIRVAIPEQYEISSQEGQGARSGAKGLSRVGRTHGRTTSETLTLTPATLADFDCYAVNVVASDIPVESRISQCVGAPLSSNRRAGILGGMIAAGGGSIDLKVTAGTSRTFQLLGFKTTATSCLAVEDVLSKRVEMKTSQPYLLAETTIDIQSDATVRLKVEYDPLRPVNGMSDCMASDSTGSEPAYRLSFVRQTTGVAAGEALGSLQAPSVEILDSTGARVTSGSLASTVLVLSLSGVSQSVASLQATAGVADFAGSGIVLTQAGSMRWAVGAISGSSISSTLSGNFVVSPGAPQLSTSSIESSSSSLLAGGSTAVTVRVRDLYGNAVTGATGSFGVFGTHPVSWYPSGAVSLGDQGSVSSSLSSTMAGSATPIFALSGLTLTLSPAISVIPGSIASVSVMPATPSTIPFGQTVTMTARAYDSYSNLVTTLSGSASQVSLARSSGGLLFANDFDSPSSGVASQTSVPVWSGGATSLNAISILGAGDFRFYVKVGTTIGQSAVTSVTGTSLVVPIEMLDQPVSHNAGSAWPVTLSRISIDPTPYQNSSANAYFEVLALNAAPSLNREIDLTYDGAVSAIATLTLTENTVTYPKLYRIHVPSFDWSSTQNYYVEIRSRAGWSADAVKVLAARIVVEQRNAVRTRLYYPLTGCEVMAPIAVPPTATTHQYTSVPISTAGVKFPVKCTSGGGPVPRSASVLRLDPAKNIGLSANSFALDSNLQSTPAGTASVHLMRVSGAPLELAAVTSPGDHEYHQVTSSAFSTPLGSDLSISVSVNHSAAEEVFVGRAGLWIDYDRLKKAQVFYRIYPRFSFSSTAGTLNPTPDYFMSFVPIDLMGAISSYGVVGTGYAIADGTALQLTYGYGSTSVGPVTSAGELQLPTSSLTGAAIGGGTANLSSSNYPPSWIEGAASGIPSHLMSGTSYHLPTIGYSSDNAGAFVNSGIMVEVGSGAD